MPRLVVGLIVLLAALAGTPASAQIASTSTTVASTPNPSAHGQPVTFTATVAGNGGGAPTGTVTYKDGATALGTSTVNTLGVGHPMAAGTSHSCALTSAGGVQCWGDNTYGQLGNTTNSGTSNPNPTPLDVTGLTSGVVALALGEAHSCALTSAGGVKCWGSDLFGQLGDTGNVNPNPAPVDVPGLTSGVRAITAGGYHTCALTGGGVTCWGTNGFGQLGNATNTGINTANPPTAVAGLSGVAAIAAGYHHTCALTGAGGIKCWGWNQFGQLGNGTSDGDPHPTPGDVSGLTSGVTAVATGFGYHTCALTGAGGVKCWGLNYYGELGVATNNGTDNPNPTPIDVTGLTTGVAALAQGDNHTCALTGAGGVKCWGFNQFGQLGNTTNSGTGDANPTPADVTGLTSGVVGIVGGTIHTCALTGTGAAKCWGINYSGQLGNATNNLAYTPNPGPLDVTNFGDGAGAQVYGQATLSTAALAAGARSITAEYGGDSNHNPSTSPVLTQTVDVGVSSTALGSSANPSVFSQSVTFTATVSGGTATGTVTFKDGGTDIGSGSLSGNVATLTTASLALGDHSITAVYGGDGNLAGSTSAPVTQTVNQGATTIALVATPNPSHYGETVSFTATVAAASPAAGTPTGLVSLIDTGSGNTFGLGTLDGGTVTIQTSALTIGTHTIVAFYGGDGNFAQSLSSAVTQTVNGAITSTTLASSVNPSNVGQSVTFTATVVSSAGTPDGTVTFFIDDGATLGTGNLSGGNATLSTAIFSAGAHTITAEYSGGSVFAASISSGLTQTVRLPTTVSLGSSVNPSSAGQSVTFTATVEFSDRVLPAVRIGERTAQSVPEGTVTFKDGGVTLGTGDLSGGSATLSTANLSAGTHTITAEYSGGGVFAASISSGLTQTVRSPTTVSLVSSMNPSNAGQSVTFTATVELPDRVLPAVRIGEPAAQAVPLGNITFKDFGTALGASPLSGGVATFDTSSLRHGIHSITAEYEGDEFFAPSASPALAQNVRQSFFISAFASPSSGGTVTGGGLFPAGSQATVTATPNAGYAFVNWTDGGSLILSTSPSYTFTVDSDRSLVANFVGQNGGDLYVSSRSGTDSGACPITAPCATLNYALQASTHGDTITILDGGVFGPIVLTGSITIRGPADGSARIVADPAQLPGCIGKCANTRYAVTVGIGPYDTVSLDGLQMEAGPDGFGALHILSGGVINIKNNVFLGNATSTAPIVSIQPDTWPTQVNMSKSEVADNANGGAILVDRAAGLPALRSSSGPSAAPPPTSVQMKLQNMEVHHALFGLKIDVSAMQAGSSVTTSISDSEFFSFNGSAVTTLSATGYGAATTTLSTVSAFNTGGPAVNANGPSSTVILTNGTLGGDQTGVRAVNGATVITSIDNTIKGNGLDVSGTMTPAPRR